MRFDEVVDAWGVDVLRLARAMVGPVDADEVWSDTMFAALQAWPRFEHSGSVRAWLCTIAYRCAIDLKRRDARRGVTETVLPAEPVSIDRGFTDVEVRLDWGRSPLVARLAQLTERQRVAVVARHVVDLSADEIGQVLGCTSAAARQAVAEGLARLRRSGAGEEL